MQPPRVLLFVLLMIKSTQKKQRKEHLFGLTDGLHEGEGMEECVAVEHGAAHSQLTDQEARCSGRTTLAVIFKAYLTVT